MIRSATRPKPLTDKQRGVLTAIAQYYAATGEACSIAYLSRRLNISRSAVYLHLQALHRKGWIPAVAVPSKRSSYKPSHA